MIHSPIRQDPEAASPALRIVVVDDDPAARFALRALLQEAGFVVDVARDGAEGVALAQRSHPDLVILDLALPGVNGIEAAALLRNDPRTAAIPLLALTASWLGSAFERLQQAGFSGGLRKPIAPELVLREIVRLVSEAPRVAPLGTPALAG